MRLVTPKQMAKIDEITISKAGIPGLVLMENAAIATVNVIIQELGDVCGVSFLVIAGVGNNGGDAFSVARHLHNKGAKVVCYFVGNIEMLSDDASTNFNILKNIGLKVNELSSVCDIEGFVSDMHHSRIIVDGIFGTGISREIEGINKEVIKRINERRTNQMVVSLDIPSGVNGESGLVMGMAVIADITVCFGFMKQGLILSPGCGYVGKCLIADISISEKVIFEDEELMAEMKSGYVEMSDVVGYFGQRRTDTHKGDYGKVLIITGSTGMTGAGSLAGSAAMRSGAGLTYIAGPASMAISYAVNAPECIYIPLDETNDGKISRKAIEKLEKIIAKVDTVLIGPGLGVSEDVKVLVSYVLNNCSVPLILDADALNAFEGNAELLKNRKSKGPVVITPHEAEMSRLEGTNHKENSDINRTRIDIARNFAVQNDLIVVLKGYRTITATPNGFVQINSTGNPGMATAGSGDVLAGTIAGLVAQVNRRIQDLDAIDQQFITRSVEMATIVGVFLHGLAGDLAKQQNGEYGMVASDIVMMLPKAITTIKD